jgi:glutamate-1-semialdehyde 2,1-aminomutase
MGCIPPTLGYLQGLRDLCDAHGTLLIFDEVMTGFRLARGGAQERFGVFPDLTCLGKVVGGGMPLAAFGGRTALMQHLSPVGAVYQAGTLSGNPVAVAAGRAALAVLAEPGTYDRLEAIGDAIDGAIRPHVARHGLSMSRVGTMFTIFFRSSAPVRFDQVGECDLRRFGRFHRACLDRGIYLPCSQYEAAFLNLALTADHVAAIGAAIGDALDATASV